MSAAVIDLDRLTSTERARLAVRLAPLMRELRSRLDFVWLYAIQAGEGGPVKIGVTVNIPERLKTLQQANAKELIGLAAWRAMPGEEKRYHETYAYARIRGEWFRPVPELLEDVAREGGVYCDWP